MNVRRVQDQVKKGGYSVPIDKIKSRYEKSLLHLSKVMSLVNIAKGIDNSGDIPQLIIEMEKGHAALHETEDGTIRRLQELINGTK